MKRLFLALPLMAAACTTAPKAPPRITAPKPIPVIAPPAPAVAIDWRDKPYAPGAWHYADRTATYGPAGAPPLLSMQCDPAHRIVVVSVAGEANSLTIRTSYAERSWPAQPGANGRSQVSFAAADPVLDQIAFSRGRFSVSGPGIAEIDIPAWAEPSRVVEDCRS
jgi:hypothetical protein